MAFHNIDPVKYRYLLSYGTREGELQRFFKDRHRQLIARGAHRLRHPPSNRKDRLEWLVNRLPVSTDEVVRDHFQKHITLEAPESVDEILEWFRVFNDQSGDGLPPDDAKRLARSALVHLFATEPDPRLLAYLAATPGRLSATDVAATEPKDGGTDDGDNRDNDEADDESTFVDPAQVAAKLPVLLTAAAFGQIEALQEAVADLPGHLRTFVDGLLSSRMADAQTLEAAIEALPPASVERTTLESLRNRAQIEPAQTAAQAGLEVLTPDWYKGERPQVLRVIGVMTNERNDAVFVRPLALENEGTWLRLTEPDRLALFPTSGDVMTHRGIGKRVPHLGEYVCWTVEFTDRTTGRTRYHLTEEAERLYEVVEIEAPSTEPDDVRSLLSRAVERRRTSQPLLFLLSDGLVIAPRLADVSRDDAFDQPWSVWAAAQAVSLDGRLLHFGLPKGQPALLDLAPIELVVKRAVRAIGDSRKQAFTKKQLSELGDMLRSEEAGLAQSRVRRVLRQLDAITLDVESVDQLLPIALDRPEVQARIDEYVDAEVRKRIEARDSILTEVESARARKQQLQNEVRTLEQRLKRLEAEATSKVETTFIKAIDNGLETLAQAAIFRQLSGHPRSFEQTHAAQTQTGPRILAQRSTADLDDNGVLLHLKSHGIRSGSGLSALMAVKAAREMGVALVVRGGMARHVGRILARHGSGEVLTLQVPLGFSDVAGFDEAIGAHSSASNICLLNADCAPLEIYASSLIDQIVAHAVEGEATRIVVIATCGEDLSMGIPDALRRFTVELDLAQLGAKAELEPSLAVLDMEAEESPWLPRAFARLRSWAAKLESHEIEALSAVVAGNIKVCR